MARFAVKRRNSKIHPCGSRGVLSRSDPGFDLGQPPSVGAMGNLDRPRKGAFADLALKCTNRKSNELLDFVKSHHSVACFRHDLYLYVSSRHSPLVIGMRNGGQTAATPERTPDILCVSGVGAFKYL